ncbi:GntR family transcriptional regulator, partial [Novosphingobium sp. AAP83]
MITDDLTRLTALLDETVARAESRPPSEPQLSEEIGTSRGRLRTL